MYETTKRAWLAAVAALALAPSPACDLESDPIDDDDDALTDDAIGREELELVGAPETDESYATVMLQFPKPSGSVGLCSGTAITDHWIITAAHCMDGLGSGVTSGFGVCSGECDWSAPAADRDVIFMGGASYYKHPDYDPGWLSGVDGSDDLGLVKLGGAGMKGFPRGRIYADARQPWYDPFGGLAPPVDWEHYFTTIGYGNGSDPGGPGCNESGTGLTLGVKRIREGLHFRARNYVPKSVPANGPDGHGVCFGDSGGPWFLERGGDLLAFAVNSYMEDLWWWDDVHGTLIPPKWSWIRDTTASAGLPIDCRAYYSDGYRHLMCEDAPVFVRLDAEYGSLTSPMTIKNDSRASQGKYITVPNGASPGGSMSYTFSVPRHGFYRVWGRVIAPSGGDDSFYVRMDGGPSLYWDTPTTSNWLWDAVNDNGVADPAIFELTAGTHTIVVSRREDGARLDRLIITNTAVWRPWEVWVEAESAALTWPMRKAYVVGGQIAWVPNGGGTGGAAAFNFGVQPSADYHIWGLVRAPSGSDNSFYATVDEGEKLYWSIPVKSDFQWDRVSKAGAGDATYHLDGGWHTFDLEQREDGTSIDKILITNDLGFVPKAPGPLVIGGTGGGIGGIGGIGF
jgi:hypothetical protein